VQKLLKHQKSAKNTAKHGNCKYTANDKKHNFRVFAIF